MKVISIQQNTNQKQGIPLYNSYPQEFREKTSAGLCEKNNKIGNNVTFSGGLPGKSGAAAKSLGDKILSSKAFDKILTLAEGSPVVCSSLFALGLAGVLRPATILSLPGKKDKEDKIYACGHSLASGVIGFISSIILTTPLNQMMDEVKKHPRDYMKKLDKYFTGLEQKGLKNTQKFRNMETLVKVGCDSVIAVPRAIITIALIPPILKYVFGIEKKAKQQVMMANAQPNDNSKFTGMNLQKSFQDFRGGLK